MFRKVLIFCFALAVHSAPAPYYSLVETPTSRFEQKFLLSTPQLHEPYKIQHQQVRPHSEFQFPKQQQVLYYYPENSAYQQAPQNHEQISYKVFGENHPLVQPQHNQQNHQIVHHHSNPNGHVISYPPPVASFLTALNLNEVGAKKEEIKEETDLNSLLEDTSTNNSCVTKIETDVEESGKITSKNQFVDNSVINDSSEGTTAPKFEKLEHLDVRVDQTKTEDEDSESVVADSIQRSAMSLSEAEETSTKIMEIVTESENIESTTFEATPAPEVVPTTRKPLLLSDFTSTIATKAAPQKGYQERVFTRYPELGDFYQRFYVANGPPQFYGSIDPSALIFSIQQLQPIVRTTGIKASEEEKITQFSMSTEPSSALRIHVVDEDGAMEGSDTAPEQVSTQPQQPALVLKQEMETSREDKREQSVIEARDISDESSIAQAKPSGIAIAGVGGVASSKPVANAISGPKGLSVSSPSATAVAGDFSFDDQDRQQTNPRRIQPI